jgi:hypothetical protein
VRLRRPLQRSTADAVGRCGPGIFRSGPRNRALIVPTDRNVSIATILSSTRFPASGEIARSLIIDVSAMYPTKLLEACEHSSS